MCIKTSRCTRVELGRGSQGGERKGWEEMERRKWKGRDGMGGRAGGRVATLYLATLKALQVLTCPKCYPDPIGVTRGEPK